MKKKVLAALLAVCMILSTCVLFASAEVLSSGYVEKKDISGTLIGTNLRKLSGTYNITLKATVKESVELPASTKEVNADNIDLIYTFTAGSSTIKFKGGLDSYFTIESSSVEKDKNKVSAVLKSKSANENVYSVKSGASIDTESDTVYDASALEQICKYNLGEPNLPEAKVSKWTNKLCSVTMGVRFFGKTYDNLVASEIAYVKAEIKRAGGASTSTTSSVTNKIEDLMIGDHVKLTALLKPDAAGAEEWEKNSNFYAFNCWVDGSGNVLTTASKDPNVFEFDVDGTSTAIYAAFVETKSRVTIDYSSTGNGKVVYEEGREVFSGDAQISVLAERKATFTFVPDEGYEVAHVKVDGKDVASFLSLVDSTDLLDALKVLIAATDKDNYSYTFTAEQLNEVNGNHTIEVEFQKVKVLEEPSGKDLPTVAAEGITLATGADAENGDGKNGGATTVPAEDGAAANGGSAASGVVNPATGSTGAIAVFATLSVAACAAFVTAKKKED